MAKNRLVFYAFCALALAACSPYGIPEAEYQALVTFYEATDGANWSDNRGWLSDEQPCGWYGIVCGGGHVVSLTMNWNNVSGPLPAELADLTELRQLVLYYNHLTGSLPPELGQLDKLEILILHDNRFEGGIPAEWGGMRSLVQLDLVKARLSGPLPPELGQLSNLMVLNLKGNAFSGPLPEGWAALSNLEGLFLSNNALEGAVPEAWAEGLGKLRMFAIYGNDGITAIPPALDELPDTASDMLDFSAGGDY